MARFIPAALIGLTAAGLLIGGLSPAWWITGLVAIGFAAIVAVGVSVSFGRGLPLAPYLPAIVIGVVAAGLLIAGAAPAWWITGLVAVGFAMVVFMGSR